MATTKQAIRREVRKAYGEIALSSSGCCGGCCGADAGEELGYAAKELKLLPESSFLGLGSGNPVAKAALRSGETVLDLGSGPGADAFIAARRVGPRGRVIGVDMTPEMVARARDAAKRGVVTNVEFHRGLLEKLPVASSSVDVVLSNCVINLSPEKKRVFDEAFRVLRGGGRMVISDIVRDQKERIAGAACGCVAGAEERGEYLKMLRTAGFRRVEVLESRRWDEDPAGRASSITVRAYKPRKGVRR